MSDAFTFILHLCCSNVSDFSTEFNLYTIFSSRSWNLSSLFLLLGLEDNELECIMHIYTLLFEFLQGISWQVYWMIFFCQCRHTECQLWKIPVRFLWGKLQTRQMPSFVWLVVTWEDFKHFTVSSGECKKDTLAKKKIRKNLGAHLGVISCESFLHWITSAKCLRPAINQYSLY